MEDTRVVKQIPPKAVEVVVTHVASPYLMKMYEKEDYATRLDDISKKLRLQMKKRRLKEYNIKAEPSMGDSVIIQNELRSECELPAWWVRGVLGNYCEKTKKYYVFLVDHGYIIETSRDDFTVVPKKLIAYDYLISSAGIHNLIPTEPKENATSSGQYTKLTSKWSDIAIQITRECIASSSRTFFDYQAVDENKVVYGELYLVLEDEIVSLSDILVSQELAIFLSKDVSRLIRSPNYDIIKKVNSIDDGFIIEVEAKSIESPRKHRVIVNETRDAGEAKRRAATSNKFIRHWGEDCQQILVRSSHHCKRLNVIADARFPVNIHKVLSKQSIVALGKLQSYMCPAVSKGLNVVAVGPPKCGKTLGYLMPIVSNIATCNKLPKGNKPIALILCSSTSNVLDVKALASDFLQSYTDIRCVAGYNGRPNRSLVADIYNGCQIFVATPPFLVRFINRDDHRKLLNFEDLTHLVIDGIDVIFDKYYEPFQQLFARHIVKARTEKSLNLDKSPLQIVAVSRHWSTLLNGFAKQCMTDSYVCIGSYMEAAIFGRIKPKLHIVDSGKKMQQLKDLLGDQQTSMIKTMVVCQDSKEAEALNEFLSGSEKTLLATESMMFTDINGISECWKATVSGLYPILVCTDEVLVNLNITDVEWLIHYSVALPSKTQFYFRFSTLMDNLRKGNGKSKVAIIVDETNDVQLYGLVSVLERCGVKLRPEFMAIVTQISATLDSRKKTYPICDNVKAFGSCPKTNSCPYRHCALADVDTPVTPIKIGDCVKLVVTYVHNATHYTARVIEYISPYKEVTKYSAEECTRFSAALQTYYANKSNRRCRKRVQVGDVCALEASVNDFQRVKVLNVVTKDSDDVPITVEAKCVDTGAVLPAISAMRLMEIPEDLASRDTHLVEVFLTGLAPYDDEYEWNFRAFDDVYNWFTDNTKPHSYVIGKVCLHIADTLWVDPLEIRTRIIGHPDLVSASLKRHLIRLKHAVPCQNHLTQLYELCEVGMVRDANGESVVPSSSPGNRSEIDETETISG